MRYEKRYEKRCEKRYEKQCEKRYEKQDPPRLQLIKLQANLFFRNTLELVSSINTLSRHENYALGPICVHLSRKMFVNNACDSLETRLLCFTN